MCWDEPYWVGEDTGWEEVEGPPSTINEMGVGAVQARLDSVDENVLGHGV